MKKVLPRLIVLSGVITILWIAGSYVNRQRIVQRSTLSGFFESQPATLSSRVGGRVLNIPAEEGQAVTAGTTLVVLEAKPEEAQTGASEALAEQARTRAAQTEKARREEAERLAAQVREAESVVDKAIAGPRKEEIEAARSNLRAAQARLAQLRSGPRPEEIERARAVVSASEARLDKALAGATPVQRKQAQADLEVILAQEALAQKEAERQTYLEQQGATSRRVREQAETAFVQARKRREWAEAAIQNLDTRPEDIEAAKQDVAQARAQLKLLQRGTRKEEIAAATASAQAVEQNLRLLQRGSRPEDVEAARARLQQARVAFEAVTSGSGRQRVAEAEAGSRAAARTAEASGARTSEKTVKATGEGVVERVLVAPGDLVSPNQPLVRITYPKDIYLRVYVPENDLAKVKLGDVAQVKVDGMNELVEAVVEAIGRLGEFTPSNLQTPDERGKQVFPVRLRLRKPDARIKEGMYASVRRIGDWP